MRGLGVAVSRRLRPGHSDSAYLWMDEAHQQWVDECVQRADDIKALVLEQIDSEDEDHVAQLFTLCPGSWLPARCGYWLGDLIAQQLLEDTTVHDLMTWGHDHARTSWWRR